MRKIKDLGIVHDTDYLKFPSGTIKNETDIEPGTPVIREVYGDILTNIYAILKDRQINFNGLEDNELNGYQLLNALKLLTNDLNDSERILNKAGNTYSLDLRFSLLPNKYVLFARASENYVDSQNSTINGADGSYPFSSSTGFNQGDEVLIVLDQAGSRAYNMTHLGGGTNGELFNIFGTPLQFNDSDKLWYQEEGKLFSDVPEIFDLQEAIRTSEGNPDLLVYEMFAFDDKIICLFFDGNSKYYFRFFNLNDWNNPLELNPNFSMNSGSDFKMHAYFDGRFVYLTNAANQDPTDSKITKAYFDFQNQQLTFVQELSLQGEFNKTTNGIASGKGITTFINGRLIFWGFDGNLVDMGIFNSFIGVIFKIKENSYYTNGEVAKKWNLY